jgi:hypothetical protein
MRLLIARLPRSEPGNEATNSPLLMPFPPHPIEPHLSAFTWRSEAVLVPSLATSLFEDASASRGSRPA